MSKRMIVKAALDGLFHAVLLLLLNHIAASSWTANWSVEGLMLLALGMGLLSAGGYVLLIRKETVSRRITGISLLSAGFCLLALIGGIVWMMEVPFRLLPVREGNAGDGLLLLLITIVYLLFSGALRVIAWAAMSERCWTRRAARW